VSARVLAPVFAPVLAAVLAPTARLEGPLSAALAPVLPQLRQRQRPSGPSRVRALVQVRVQQVRREAPFS